MTPPRKAARGREHDRLIVYLVLTGNATLSTAEYLQLTSRAASRFFETPGALTTAMRAAAGLLNSALLERNIGSSANRQYAIGWLVLAAVRGVQCTMLLSGPTHVYALGSEAVLHTYDPALSGKGLGLGQGVPAYFTQTDLHPGDKLIFSGKPAAGWETLFNQAQGESNQAARRRLLGHSTEDVNAVLVQVEEGTGSLNVVRPAPAAPAQTEGLSPSKGEESAPPEGTALPPEENDERAFTPSAYAIPPQTRSEGLPTLDEVLPFPPSIPRLKPTEASPLREMDEPIMEEPREPRQPSERTRRVARGLVGGMRTWRNMLSGMGNRMRTFLPHLLPGENNAPSSTFLLVAIAVIVPILVVTSGATIYFTYGRSITYERYMIEAENARTRAISAGDPARERNEWKTVLLHLRKAEELKSSPELEVLRREAQNELDSLEGILRLNFYPAFATGIGGQISRLAANETDLYILDAVQGRVLHAAQVGRGFEMDAAFRCEQGEYGEYQVGPIVDIQILPRLNSMNAAVLGIDAGGMLLYCAPEQVGQAIPLPVPDTNWGRITGFTYDGGNLYVLDAPSRAIWVYTGQDASFIEQPYFYFGGQIPEIEDSIDLVVNGDEMFLLHADSRLSHCDFSRLDTVPTRCDDPVTLVNPLPAYKDTDLFGGAHLTQMMLTAPPDITLLMLDADNRSVMRFSPRSLELINQIYPMPGNSLQQGPAGAMTVNPNRVLFLAVEDQVYFATDMP